MLPLDLHVLSTPPAFILSQDQTLHKRVLTKTDQNKLRFLNKTDKTDVDMHYLIFNVRFRLTFVQNYLKVLLKFSLRSKKCQPVFMVLSGGIIFYNILLSTKPIKKPKTTPTSTSVGV